MKKWFVVILSISTVLVFSQCSSSKKVSDTTPKLSYESHVQNIIMTKCSPCHIPVQKGKKKDYSNFTAVQGDIDEILRRIQLNPGEKGFMPFRGHKLGSDTILIFQQWKDGGMIEK
jgi:hypothetical protein